jgi:hypothetical protein
MPTQDELQAALTQQQKMDASAAWLLANRPDLVNPTRTAAEAEAYRTAYFNNTLPVLPTEAPNQYHYGQPTPGETYRIYDFSGMSEWQRMNVDAPYREVSYQEYTRIKGMTPDQAEQQKHNVFFHPDTVDPSTLSPELRSTYARELLQNEHEYYRQNPSPYFLAIIGEYAAQQNRVVGGGGVMFQGAPSGAGTKNPYREDSAAGIAWDLERTGSAVNPSLGQTAISEGYKGSMIVPYAYNQKTGAYDIDWGISTEPTRVTGSGEIAGMPESTKWHDQTVDTYMALGGWNQVVVRDSKIGIDYQTGEFGVYQQVPGHSIYNLIGGGGRAAAQSGMFTFGAPTAEKGHVYEQWEVGVFTPATKDYMETHSRLGAEAYAGFVRDLDGRVLTNQDAISRYGNYNNLANFVQQIPAGKSEAPGADIPWSIKAGSPAMQYMDENGMTGKAIDVGGYVNVPADTGRLAGVKTVASSAVITGTTAGELPKPFVSKPVGADGAAVFTPYQQSILGGYSGGLIGYALWGEKSPQVIKGALGSVVDEITGLVGWRPFASAMREVESPTGITPDIQTSLETESKNLAAVKVYDYGEFSRWGEGAGDMIRGKLGFTTEQLEVYGTRLEQKKGIEYIPEKIVYGTGYTLSTHPEKIISAYGAGVAMVFGGEIIGAGAQATGLATRAGAFALSHPTIATVGGGALRYGIPAGMLGMTYYSASEGLTATPERTTINIGKGVPELAFMLYGGASGYGAVRVMDSGYLGFETTQETIDILPEAITTKGRDIFEIRPGKIMANRGGIDAIPETATSKMALTQPERALYELPSPMHVKKVVPEGSQYVSEPYIPGEIRLPGVRPLLEGTEMGSVSQTTRMGLAEPWKTKATTDYILGGGIEPRIVGQPVSATTAAMREAQAAAWLAPSRVPTGAMPMDMLPGVSKIGAGLEPMAMPNPFAGLAESMGVRIEPISPKGIGRTTESGFGYGGAGMSQGMLESVVTQGAIKTPTSYASAMDIVIGQKTAAARMKPVSEAAMREQILPSVTKMPGSVPSMAGFEDITMSVIEGGKRTATGTSAAGAFRYKGVQLGYLRDALKARKGIVIEEPAVSKVPSAVVQIKPSRKIVLPNTFTTTKTTQSPAQIRTPSPAQTGIQTPVKNQTPVQPSGITPIQNPSKANAPSHASAPALTQTPVQTQSPAQTQFPTRTFAIIPAVDPLLTQIPASVAQPDFPTRTGFPTIPYAPTPTPPPTKPTLPPTYPGNPPPTPRTPDPIIPGIPTGFYFPSGGGAESPGRRPRRAAFKETFLMGLDIGFLGRRTVKAKSYVTPASKKRKPAKPPKPSRAKPAKSTKRKRS